MKQSIVILSLLCSLQLVAQDWSAMKSSPLEVKLKRADSIMGVTKPGRVPKFAEYKSDQKRSVKQQLDSLVCYELDSDSIYHSTYSYRFAYDATNFTSTFYSRYHYYDDSLRPSGKNSWTYDAEGKWLGTDYYSWDDSLEVWDLDSRTQVSYDAAERIFEVRVTYFNTVAGSEVEYYSKSAYEYDSFGDHISTTYYDMDQNGTGYEELSTFYFYYDSEHRLIEEMRWYSDEPGIDIPSNIRQISSYNSNSDLIREEGSYWSFYLDAWILNTRHDYVVDGEGSILAIYDSFWNVDSLEWFDPSTTRTYDYDSSGNIVGRNIWQPDWSVSSGEIYQSDDDQFTYNEAVGIGEVVLPPDETLNRLVYGDSYYFTFVETIKSQPLTTVLQHNQFDGSLYARQDLTYFYSEKVEEDPEPEGEIRIYPNPAESVLNLDFVPADSKFELTNSCGQGVRSVNVTGSVQLAIDDLDTGLYFYTLHTKSAVLTGKIVVL